MLPLHKIAWNEWRAPARPERVPEPEAMTDLEQIRSYIQAYEWGGPTSALQLYHLKALARTIRPGDTVLDLACGPGPLLLELARLYPSCRFIGADVSPPMLAALNERAAAEGVTHIRTLCEDIRELPSLAPNSVDVVISTSALHHLPDLPSLRATFERARAVMKPDATLYVFDFGLLRSPRTRELMVAEVAKLAPPVTARDYAMSLRAAFPVAEVFAHAGQVFGPALVRRRSALADFFYFLRTPPRLPRPDQAVVSRLQQIWRSLSAPARMEHAMLTWLQRGAG